MRACKKGQSSRFIQYGVYPLLFLAMLGYAAFEVNQPAAKLGSYYGVYLSVIVIVMLLVETLHPLRNEWRMTKVSFFRRDLPYMLVGGLTLVMVNYAAGWAIVHFGMTRATAHLDMPLIPAVILVLLIPDFLWYWVHRLSHEGRGRFGQWLWSMHVAHHLPQQVYLLMHGVAHPINTIIVRAIMTVPMFLLGFSVEALFVANLVVGLQGFVSHFNVDIRAGWVNYILMGTELHRYHHSADPQEAKNYGAVVTLWDQLFGTYYHRPGVVARRLGVERPADYPQDRELLRVLALPFKWKQGGVPQQQRPPA